MNKLLLTGALVLFSITGNIAAQPRSDKTYEKVVTLRFVPGYDMCYIPWQGNITLYELIINRNGGCAPSAQPPFRFNHHT